MPWSEVIKEKRAIYPAKIYLFQVKKIDANTYVFLWNLRIFLVAVSDLTSCYQFPSIKNSSNYVY